MSTATIAIQPELELYGAGTAFKTISSPTPQPEPALYVTTLQAE